MITRENTEKPVMVITDMPLVEENKRGVAFSDPSSIALKDALRKASMNECKNLEEKFILDSANVCYTYLSLTRYAEEDVDWEFSIVSKKNIPEGRTDYKQIPWLKDIWVSEQIMLSINSLVRQIAEVKPKLIVIGGKWSFMFFASLIADPTTQLATIGSTKNTPKSKKMFGNLNKYRSSLLTLHDALPLQKTVVIPILTPSHLFLVKEKSYVVRRDYGKIAHWYRKLSAGASIQDVLAKQRKPICGTDKQQVLNWLQKLWNTVQQQQTKVVFDVETRQGYKDCIGIAYEAYESLTIPFTEMYVEENTQLNCTTYFVKNHKEILAPNTPLGVQLTKFRHAWNIEDQIEICHLLWQIMLHPNCLHIGQNYNYDCQYYFHRWKLRIFSFCDTMVLHHVLHNVMQKDLAMLASMYCMDYVYWKDDLEVKDNTIRWEYCGQDCQYTYSVADILLQLLKYYPQELQEFYYFQQFQVVPKVATIMNRGVKIALQEKENLRIQFEELMKVCEQKFNFIFNEEVNLNSTPQVKNAFKTLLGIKPLVNRKTKAESFGADAMLVYLEEYPEWRTLLTLFLEYKSIKVFVRTFLSAKVDEDGMMRCDYNPAGTKTYRFASRKNVFGNGMNLANVPAKGKIDLRVSLQEFLPEQIEDKNAPVLIDNDSGEIIETDADEFYKGGIALPNCKEIFLPDNEEQIFFDGDYSAIDLHFVVYESGCKFLKDIMRAGKDVYSILASHYYQREIVKDDEERQIFKSVAHGSNYLGKAPTLAAKAGLSVSAVKRVIEWYFSQCPEIPNWHKFLESHALQYGYITNVFGARNEVFDTQDPMWLNKLVAWQPQSSAAILVNRAICRLETTEPLLQTNAVMQAAFAQQYFGTIETKLQTHDSISGVFHNLDGSAIARLIAYMELEIVFEKNAIRSERDSVIIPAGIKISDKSYGNCGKIPKDSVYQPSNYASATTELRKLLTKNEKLGMYDGKMQAKQFNLMQA